MLTQMHHTDAAQRLVRRSDMVACKVAFIDCKLPGSTLKENYSIIGAGVTQAADQIVNIVEPHGFALGAAAMPHGVTNNLHIHYTAEVFIVFSGEWLFRWGANGDDGTLIGRAGDVISIPTWIFRGFTNIGADDGWVFTALGRDDTGGVIWHPSILQNAAEHGLFLRKNNMLVDTTAGQPKPDEADLIAPLTPEFIAALRKVSSAEMAARVTTQAQRVFHHDSLLQAVLPGHKAALAPVIGHGMTQSRLAAARVSNPHGFCLEWLRIEPFQSVGPFRVGPKQAMIVRSGRLTITLGRGAGCSQVTAAPWDVFSVPDGAWRTLAAAHEAVELVLLTSGDGRALIEWEPETIADALAAGYGLDPNYDVAPAVALPCAGPVSDAA